MNNILPKDTSQWQVAPSALSMLVSIDETSDTGYSVDINLANFDSSGEALVLIDLNLLPYNMLSNLNF